MAITRLASTAFVALALVSLTGCGDSSPPVQAEAPTATTGETGATAADESTKFAVEQTGTWGVEVSQVAQQDEVIAENGAQVMLTLDIGKLTRLSDIDPSNKFGAWANSCSEVDAAATAFIPLRLEARNWSEHSLPFQVEFLPALGTEQFDLRPTLADVSGCWDFVKGYGDRTAVDFGGELDSQETRTEELVFVVREYYDERFPNGRPTVLMELWMQAFPQIVDDAGNSLSLEQICFSGDGGYQPANRSLDSIPVVGPMLQLYGSQPSDAETWDRGDMPDCE